MLKAHLDEKKKWPNKEQFYPIAVVNYKK